MLAVARARHLGWDCPGVNREGERLRRDSLVTPRAPEAPHPLVLVSRRLAAVPSRQPTLPFAYVATGHYTRIPWSRRFKFLSTPTDHRYQRCREDPDLEGPCWHHAHAYGILLATRNP